MKYLILFLFTLQAQAAPLDAVVTAGIGKNVLGHQPFERYGALGIQYGNAWKVRANGGYWLALGDGERASGFGSLQGGLEVVGRGGEFAQLMFGPALITQDDVKISGNFQFHLSGSVGVKDGGGRGLSFQWVHFSNAGIKQPNQGRDLLTAQMIFPLHFFGESGTAF